MTANDDAGAIQLDVARERLGGCDDSMLSALAEALLEECPLRITEIEQALSAGDAKGVMRAGHTLKGAADVFGASAVYESSEAIEEAGQAKNLEIVPELLARLKDQADQMNAALRAYVNATEI